MSICWDCHWGWPKPVADIFLEAKTALDGDDTPLLYGPGHIVWADENFDSAQWCLENFDKYRGDLTDEEAAVARYALEQLAALPDAVVFVCPPDYDGEHPENYPPPVGVEMVKV
jgi:hypothetical protein